MQKPHPPIYLAAYAPPALRRVVTLANGWNPAGLPIDAMAKMMAQLGDLSKAAGRAPAASEVIVRANLHLTAHPLGQDRSIFSGRLTS